MKMMIYVVLLVLLVMILGVSVAMMGGTKEGLDTGTPVATTTPMGTPVAMTTTPTSNGIIASQSPTSSSVGNLVNQLSGPAAPSVTPAVTYSATYAATAQATNTPFATANATASATTTPFATVTPFATANATATPLSTVTPLATLKATPSATPAAATKAMATFFTVDPNGYIRLALSSLDGSTGQPASAMNYTNLAINMQTQLGNYGAVAMLQASNQYVQAMVNPLLNNFGIPNSALERASVQWLVGTLLVLLMKANGADAQGHAQPDIQQSLVALNASPPDIQGASAAVNRAVNANVASGNVQAVSLLQTIQKTLINYSNPVMKQMPLTPLQLVLADYPQLLIRLNGMSSPQDYSEFWGVSRGQSGQGPAAGPGSNGGSRGQAGGSYTYSGHGSYGSNWYNGAGGHGMGQGHGQGQALLNVPDPVQQFLFSRTALDGAINDMVNYLSGQGNYAPLITKMQQAQKDLNAM